MTKVNDDLKPSYQIIPILKPHTLTFSLHHMRNSELNRIKVVLVEKKRTNKWLAEQMGKDPATISKWCTNNSQPSLKSAIEIARLLEVNIDDLLRK